MSKSNSAATVAVISLIIAVCVSAQNAPAALAVVIRAKGGVLYQEVSTQDWSAAAAGLSIASGAQIKTESDGMAMIKFVSDGSMMNVKPLSQLRFDAREKKGVFLSVGAALFDVDKQKSGSFTVTTPSSVATVKGTGFWMKVGADSVSTLIVTDGVVKITSVASGKSKDVKRGQTAVCDAKGLTVRATRKDDLPEQSHQLEFPFKDASGATKTLRVDGTQE